jgi:hypothetical protein
MIKDEAQTRKEAWIIRRGSKPWSSFATRVAFPAETDLPMFLPFILSPSPLIASALCTAVLREGTSLA